MDILLINQYAGSVEMGMEYRPYHLARCWQKAGHTVTILAGDFSHLRLVNPIISQPMQEQLVEGIRYCFICTPPYRENDRRRMNNILTFARRVYTLADQIAQRYHPQVVIASSTHPFDLYGARKIAHICGAKLIYELHDLWPLTQLELYGYHRCDPRILVTQYVFERAIRSSNAIVSLLPFADDYLRQRHLPVKQYLYLPNGVVIPPHVSEQKPQKHIELMQRWRDKGFFVIAYAGSISPANALANLMQAAALLKQGIQLVCIGNGPYKVQLKRMAKQLQLHNVTFLDAVPLDQIPHLLALADGLYLGTIHSPLYDYGISMNKLFDYMLAGRPILFASNARNNPVQQANCGISVPAQQPQALAQAICQLQQMPLEQREIYGKNAVSYVCCYHDYRLLAEKFLDLMQGLLDTPGKVVPFPS